LDDRGVAPPADIVCCLDILRCLNASTREFAELSQRPNRCQLQAIGFIWRAREAALVFGGVTMHISNESLLVILFVGLVAGWLAGQIVRGAGFGLIGDLVIGIIGAFIGDWLLPQVGIHLGTGIVSAIVNAAIGAVLLLLVVGLLRGRLGGGWGGGWGRRRWW
jgi:uncharacterized membrane protein YeaQ/YmgE (transglycosylase-associated protein family)